MGAWNYDIYSNDTAQDLLCLIQEILPKYNFFNDLISELKSNPNYKYSEEKYVIADLEMDVLGCLENKDEILDLIESELTNDIDDYENPERREQELKKLEYKINNNIKVEGDFYLKNWIEEKRNVDILRVGFKNKES